LFGLFERQDITELTIPFTTGKSTWHITEANNYLPYKAVLFKPVPIGVPLDQVTSWEYTDRIYFYELWKNVSGDRIELNSTNPDIQVQGFRDGNKLYVALNNLDDFDRSISLQLQSVSGATPNDVRIKSLIINPNELAQFTDQTTLVLPESYNLKVNETVVFEYTYDTDFSYDNAIILNRHYTNESTVQAITANSSMTYTFSNVPTSLVEYATLRMSIGRKHEKSKSPTVFVNGQALSVPTNWKGYDQAIRDDFFGMIEIDVPVESLQASTSVTLEFSDSGGHLSSLVLITQTYDQSLSSTEKGISSNGEDKLILYPNPAKAIVLLDQKYIGKELRFFTLTGKEVYRAVYNGNAVDVGHLASGLYLVRCGSLFTKLVIE
ncbi:MAG: T9SS C-terminal target domain-containing protein, partial [Bacteroidetes bacterium]|nr:T9SS C-terminal target domain-containing protein [Bacteroidota bacterium]